MGSLKEFSIAISRITLGMVVLVAGLLVLDIIVYLSATGSTFTEKVMAAYEGGYDKAYAQRYEVGYQEAYDEAYKKGYEKGYEIGLGIGSKEVVPTRLELHNPTYKELREFLASDKTDSKQFVRDEYVCFDFASDLNNNAEAHGIRAAYVRIQFQEWGHAIVAFETVDRGLVFIEPQSDKQVPKLEEGETYPWQSVGADRSRDYADTIEKIQIIW